MALHIKRELLARNRELRIQATLGASLRIKNDVRQQRDGLAILSRIDSCLQTSEGLRANLSHRLRDGIKGVGTVLGRSYGVAGGYEIRTFAFADIIRRIEVLERSALDLNCAAATVLGVQHVAMTILGCGGLERVVDF